MTAHTKTSPAARPQEGLDIKLSKDALPTGIMPPDFGGEYVAGAVAPFLLSGRFVGETPTVPMIDLGLSKENAAPALMWGMLYDGWAPNPEEDGTTVFLRGYDRRGPDNETKRIYMSATTPDLVATKYKPKILRFIEQILSPAKAGKPLMKQFFGSYFDMYWDLHLGVTGDAIPREVRECGASFNAVLAYQYPTLRIVHENYMHVRETRPALSRWVDERVQAILDGKQPEADRTFVHYWIKNGGLGESFRRKDIVFECFHNFLAFSQWGNTTHGIVKRLDSNGGDPVVRRWYERTMSEAPDETDGAPFTRLDRFVMELFRTISPNPGSISLMDRQRDALAPAFSTIVTPHLRSSTDRRFWTEPEEFNPDRYKTATTTVDNDQARAKQLGLAHCPFHKTSFEVKDGRNVQLTNSAFGAVHGVVDGAPHALVDTAGYAPFGFGYRRCAGEYVTVEFVKEFLRRTWKTKLSFISLDLAHPEEIPIGPTTVVEDKMSFTVAS